MPSYSASRPGGVWPRYVSLVIGIWLFVSAFVWFHATGERTDTWILGLLIFLVSLWATAVPRARFINTALAIWLFFATLVIPHSHPATLWNNLIAAVIVFLMSLIPSRPTHTPGHRRAIPAT